MKVFKKLSLTMLSLIVCIFSALVFVGCKDDVDYEDLYVFSTEGGYVYVNDDYNNPVQWGDEGSKKFTFKENSVVKLEAVAETGYSFVKWTYAENFGDRNIDYSTQPNVNIIMDEDIIVIRAVFEAVPTAKYNISYSNGEGYEIVPEQGSTTTVNAGGQFSFKVNVLQGYDSSTLEVKVNNEIINPTNGVYLISNINENKNISVTVQKSQHEITLNSGTGYVIEPVNSNLVTSGGNFSFKVTLDEAYSDSDIVVTAVGADGNSTSLTPSQGVYTINNVTQDYTINISGVQKNSYSVQLPSDVRIQCQYVVGGNSVQHGEDVSFTISGIDSSIDLTNIQVTCNNGDIVVNKSGNTFTVNNVTTNLVFSITGINVYTHTISYSGEGFTVEFAGDTDSMTVERGDDFNFTINISSGYEKDEDTFKVMVNGEEINIDSNLNYYVIKNVSTNIQITVEGVSIKKHTVTLPSSNMYTVSAVDGYTTTVNNGDEFKFQININSGYDGSAMVVKANNTIINAVGGIYTVSNIIENVTITVEGVVEMAPNTYTVTLPVSDQYIITVEEGYSTTVSEGGSFKFTFSFTENYQSGADFGIYANGQIVNLTENFYLISNITENIEITVQGVEEITYYVQFTQPKRFVEFIYNDTTASTINDVSKGSSVSFTVRFDNNNINPEDVAINSNGSVLTATSSSQEGNYTVNSYTIQTVNDNIIVTANAEIEYYFNLNYENIEDETGITSDFFPTGLIFNISINNDLPTNPSLSFEVTADSFGMKETMSLEDFITTTINGVLTDSGYYVYSISNSESYEEFISIDYSAGGDINSITINWDIFDNFDSASLLISFAM